MLRKTLSITVIIAFLAAIIAALCWRAMLSVEMTDEISYVAQYLSIIQGQKPFYTSWSIQTAWCLTAPLLYFFNLFNDGNLEGVVLFTRLSYIVFTLIVAGYIAIKLAKKHNNIAYLAIIGCITYVPFSIFQIGYNNVAAYLLFLTAYCIDTWWNRKDHLYLWIFPGIFMGVACISYATLPVMTIIIALVIAIFNKKFALNKMLWFSMGVIIVGCIFAAWILSEASIEQVVIAVEEMLNSPHEEGKGHFLWFAIKAFTVPFIAPKRFIILLFFVLSSIGIQRYLRKKLYSKYAHFIVYVILMIPNYILLAYKPINDIFGFVLWILIMTWIFFDPNLNLKKYKVYLLIQLGFTITYALTSDNTNCLLGLVMTGMITAFIAINALIDLSEGKRHLLTAVLSLLFFAIPGLINAYGYVYRDDAVTQLDTKVEHGIYKGLYTTSKRRDFVVRTEELISTHVSSADRFCVVTREPMLYVMSKAIITSPITWDPQFLVRGYTSAEPILAYFRKLNIDYPSIIAATNSAPEDFFENDSYEIKQFIKDNYIQFLFEEIEDVKIALWRKKEGNPN